MTDDTRMVELYRTARSGDEGARANSSGATLLAPVPNLRAAATWAASQISGPTPR